ncbi:DUF948 domain-containing protein [Paenibacillus cremeus]|uniref:DUF948 domain-containing protein n=1 Tax=Paenibacillus cremeus TaxID=2163881 RepID=A0A559K3P5_9BACL|nr:DUF948 domain-containing protein [Paenibacillus cremeus]
MWWQIGLGLCMLAFLLLVVYAVKLLRSADAAMKQADQALRSMQLQIQQTTAESERLLKASTLVAEDLRSKLAAADAWFRAANESGEAITSVSRSVKSMSKTVEDTVQEARRAVHSNQDTVNDVMELTTAGLHLWHRWQAYRQSKAKEREDHGK